LGSGSGLGVGGGADLVGEGHGGVCNARKGELDECGDGLGGEHREGAEQRGAADRDEHVPLGVAGHNVGAEHDEHEADEDEEEDGARLREEVGEAAGSERAALVGGEYDDERDACDNET